VTGHLAKAASSHATGRKSERQLVEPGFLLSGLGLAFALPEETNFHSVLGGAFKSRAPQYRTWRARDADVAVADHPSGRPPSAGRKEATES